MDLPVVVGYNGKQPAEEALIWAADEAVRRRLPLVVLFAANYPGMTLPPGGGQPEPDPGSLDAAEEVTREGVRAAKEAYPDLEVRGETTATSPTRALVEASARASLVAVGSRGRGTVAGALLGSVSFTVAAGATCPVVVVKRESGTCVVGPDHPVIVGTDGSAPAARAVRFAADVATESSAELHVICGTGDNAVSTVDQQQLRNAAEEILRDVRTDLQRTHPQLTPVMRQADGIPEQALVESAADAGLIVVGSRGRGAFQGMVAGSVSLAVIQRARCPVAVVRGTEPPDDILDTDSKPARRGAARTVSPHREELANVHVQTQRLPGIGWRYTVPADRGRQLLVVVEGTGDRHLVLIDPTLDNPIASVRLNATTSSVVAALLAGAQFHIEPPEDQAIVS